MFRSQLYHYQSIQRGCDFLSIYYVNNIYAYIDIILPITSITVCMPVSPKWRLAYLRFVVGLESSAGL